jgi:hypothetical protein
VKLIVAHQILIATAIALAAIFAVRSLVIFFRGGASAELAIGLASLGVGAALSLYFRKVRARARLGERPPPGAG